MTNEEIDSFLALLKSKGWSVKVNGGGDFDESFRRRYPRIPEDFRSFLKQTGSCANAGETVWFICIDDYKGTSPSAFAWNAFELMALEAVEGDDQASKGVRQFWNDHLPFMLSVKGDYICLALSLSEKEFGSVVAVYAPDFDAATSRLFPSFSKFTASYAAVLKGEVSNPHLNDFV